jgi:hypothetical protein
MFITKTMIFNDQNDENENMDVLVECHNETVGFVQNDTINHFIGRSDEAISE